MRTALCCYVTCYCWGWSLHCFGRRPLGAAPSPLIELTHAKQASWEGWGDAGERLAQNTSSPNEG
jgi:hypothetical protein